MFYIFYFCIAFFATYSGSLAGLGGGIVIKVFMNLFSTYDVATIGVLSSVVVLTMSATNTYKNQKSGKNPFAFKNLYLYIGALIGGLIGSFLLNILISTNANTEHIKNIQNVILGLLIILTLVLDKVSISLSLRKTKINFLISAIFMGTIASFLSIGGGPVNMAILILVFSMTPKEAITYSTTIIFCSQLSNVVEISIRDGFLSYDLRPLLAMIPAAFIGGIYGNKMATKCSEQFIHKFYYIMMFVIIVISFAPIII